MENPRQPVLSIIVYAEEVCKRSCFLTVFLFPLNLRYHFHIDKSGLRLPSGSFLNETFIARFSYLNDELFMASDFDSDCSEGSRRFLVNSPRIGSPLEFKAAPHRRLMGSLVRLIEPNQWARERFLSSSRSRNFEHLPS